MPRVEVNRSRNATVVIEANAEVLFTPLGPVGTWTKKFSERMEYWSGVYAPYNKRPRWSHYGAPLKKTMVSDVKYQPGATRVDAVVGSTAPHAVYVDQGTGVHNDGAPYEAKILPPWKRGQGSLYEHTWVPGGKRNAGIRGYPVYIDGQKGQGFFEQGTARAFQNMRMRSYQVPGDPRMAKSLSTFPPDLENFVSGATPVSAAFMSNLAQWREWRDARFNSGKLLGKAGGRYTRQSQARAARSARVRADREARSAVGREARLAARAEKSRLRSQARRDEAKRNNTSKGRTRLTVQQRFARAKAAEKARFLSAARAKYGNGNVLSDTVEFRGGYFYVTIVRQGTRRRFDIIRGRLVERP